jgi:hypothetical protein
MRGKDVRYSILSDGTRRTEIYNSNGSPYIRLDIKSNGTRYLSYRTWEEIDINGEGVYTFSTPTLHRGMTDGQFSEYIEKLHTDRVINT